jgi:hypothetical protein
MPNMQTGTDARGNPLHGWKDGKVSELTTFFHVKPGHEKLMREACHEFVSNPDRMVPEKLAQIGIHELRLVLFDNDTRFMWITSFDTDWDPYIDDTLRLIGQQLYGTVFQHTVEAPEGIAGPDLPNQANAIKDMFNNNRETAVGFLSAFKDLTLRELWTDRRIRKAFEEVLDNPEAEAALQHPALAPLLEVAAD